jgi:protoheme IX farnesyltransferase
MRRRAGILLEMGKVRISSLATITMIAGYILARGEVTWSLFVVTLGVFLLAFGSSGLNQVQERDVDAVMDRTRGRPLPSRRASLTYAVAVSVVCLVSGALVVLAGSNVAAMALGLAAAAWYNGVYTPLKRVTAFAAVPGGVVGAIPPVIGWVAGGGWVLDARILAVAFFFFMWQVPHFWLLLLFSCGEDYEKAGLPSMTRTFSFDQISRITFMWIVGTAVASLSIPLFGIIDQPWVNAGLLAAGVWVVWRSARILRASRGAMGFRNAFEQINGYACVVISLLSLTGLLR